MVILCVYNEARTKVNSIAPESVQSIKTIESDKQEQRIENNSVYSIQSGALARQHNFIAGDHSADCSHVDDAGIQGTILSLLSLGHHSTTIVRPHFQGWLSS